MPHMVHFSAGICLSDSGVLKGFLEEFLRRAEIRTYSDASPEPPRTDALRTHVLNLHAARATDSLSATCHRLLPVDCSQSSR